MIPNRLGLPPTNYNIYRVNEKRTAKDMLDAGKKYEKGDVIGQDLNKAWNLYQQARKKGSADACYRTGRLLFKASYNDPQKYVEAFSRFCEASNFGCHSATYRVGQCYELGLGVDKNIEKALSFYELAASKGFSKALYALGTVYEEGIAGEANPQAAIEYYGQAKEGGNLRAIYKLGEFYEKGIHVEKDERAAFICYSQAVKKGLADYQYTLGRCYEEEIGVEYDAVAAARWYENAAFQGHAEAQYKLGECYRYGYGVELNFKKAVQWWHDAAEKGSVNGKYALGRCYLDGIHFSQNFVKAREIFDDLVKRDCQEGKVGQFFCLLRTGQGEDQECQKIIKFLTEDADRELPQVRNFLVWYYGDCLSRYNKGSLIRGDIEEMKKYLLKEKERGNLYAVSRLARISLENKQGCNEKDLRQIFEDLKRGVQRKHPASLYATSLFYLRGLGVEADFEKGLGLLQAAARAECRSAFIYFHQINYSKTRRISQNCERALFMLETKVEQNDVDLRLFLAKVYFDGETITKNLHKSIQLLEGVEEVSCLTLLGDIYKHMGIEDKSMACYRKAADKGGQSAKRELAKMLIKKSEPKDYSRIFQLYLEGAQNDKFDQLELGRIYQRGIYTEKNDVEAAKCFTRAAKLGSPSAQYKLAECYWYGWGVEKDAKKAACLYTLANIDYKATIARSPEDSMPPLRATYLEACAMLTTL